MGEGNIWGTIVGGHCSKRKLHVWEFFFTEDIVSWFDLETYSKVTEDDAIEQNTYDFLLVFYSNFGHISYRYCATVDFMPK